MPMSPRLLRPTLSGFDPRRLANLGGWWDATDSSSYTLGTGVTEWRDKSGLGQAFTQTTGASQPTVNATGINSKPALSFDGSNDFMTLGSATIGGNNLFAEAANAFSIYLITQSAGVGSFFAQAVSTEAQRVLQCFRGAPNSSIIRGTGSNPVTLTENIPLLVAMSWDGTAATARSNNSTGTATVGAAAYSSDNILIGARSSASPALFLNGRISEIIFYNRVLGSAEQSRLFQYLNAKWGLSLT